MAESSKAKIGFVGSGSASRPHYSSFTPLIPPDIEIDFKGLEIHRTSLYDIAGTTDTIVGKIKNFVAEYHWDGVMVSGAPTEVLNPGFLDALRQTLAVPVTTALNACIAALEALSAGSVLLLTPFEERLNLLIREHLGNAGVVAHAPRPFEDLGDAIKLTPDQVFELTRNALREVGAVDAIYFQGAVLDPLQVLARIETELELPVVASNPAMLWYVLSQLGLRYRIEGYGKLVEQWLPLVDAAT